MQSYNGDVILLKIVLFSNVEMNFLHIIFNLLLALFDKPLLKQSKATKDTHGKIILWRFVES